MRLTPGSRGKLPGELFYHLAEDAASVMTQMKLKYAHGLSRCVPSRTVRQLERPDSQVYQYIVTRHHQILVRVQAVNGQQVPVLAVVEWP